MFFIFFSICTQVNCCVLKVLIYNDVPCERDSVRIVQMYTPVIIVKTESYLPITSFWC